jgi:AraC family transcriptional regulator of adaptative response/methylated-DNA-[protein]-cysteine methyltransferase
MTDYARVEAMIRHLEKHRDEQPSLGELARVAGLGETQTHRLFQRWAGVTPKDFLQSLTLEHAKRRLRESASVLDAALDSGLSGPGRLHDLLVTVEAVSPGEYKNGGRGMQIEWGAAESPFGLCTVGWTQRGISHLAFHDREEIGEVPSELSASWPHADFERSDAAAAKHISRIFRADRADLGGLRAFVRATPFQLRVWRALLQVPEGHVTTYGRLAGAIGSPGAARATGTACGANPVAYLIPCHRVIRETGAINDYRWGALRKKAILGRETRAGSEPRDS